MEVAAPVRITTGRREGPGKKGPGHSMDIFKRTPPSNDSKGYCMSVATPLPISPVKQNMDLTSINTIRTLSMDGVQAANSGHPGTPMAMAPVAYTLWQEFLRF